MIKKFADFLSEAKVDYSELEFKMYKYMPDNEEALAEYYEILDSKDPVPKKAATLVQFFDNNADEEAALRYMPKGGTLRGFCEYLAGKK